MRFHGSYQRVIHVIAAACLRCCQSDGLCCADRLSVIAEEMHFLWHIALIGSGASEEQKQRAGCIGVCVVTGARIAEHGLVAACAVLRTGAHHCMQSGLLALALFACQFRHKLVDC